ncbi:MAG TPA: hypothetical protein VGB44_08680 [Flavobacterium sp.]
MKKLNIRFVMLALIATMMASCGSQMRGSAVDRTGTNGATNGNGKVPNNL